MREEIFGPVAMVGTFSDEDEAIALANDTRFGLAAGVWTRDVKRAHRVAAEVHAGTVWVNTYGMFDAASRTAASSSRATARSWARGARPLPADEDRLGQFARRCPVGAPIFLRGVCADWDESGAASPSIPSCGNSRQGRSRSSTSASSRAGYLLSRGDARAVGIGLSRRGARRSCASGSTGRRSRRAGARERARSAPSVEEQTGPRWGLCPGPATVAYGGWIVSAAVRGEPIDLLLPCTRACGATRKSGSSSSARSRAPDLQRLGAALRGRGVHLGD